MAPTRTTRAACGRVPGLFSPCRSCGLRRYREVLGWTDRLRSGGLPVTVLGTDEQGTADVRDLGLRGPALLVIGNETAGLTAAWRDACDAVVAIPMTGTASSLNAATAGSIVLYEVMRQRCGSL